MSSIVQELQKDALQQNASLTNLLMKALLVARKLKINEFEAWINNELDGYDNNKEVPKYRSIYCPIKIQWLAWDIFKGII